MITRIAVLDDYQNVAFQSADWSAVQARAEVVVFNDHVDNSDMLVERLLPFDAVCVMRERTPLGEEILQRLPNLKFIGSNAPHNASIALGTARERGIVVSFTGGRGNGALELTWALILAAARHMQAETGSFRSGGWQTSLGSDLEGATLGVMGLGKIGTRMARIGRAFGMKVIAWSENLTVQVAQAAGATLVDKATLLREADWLTLHLVLSERSRGVIAAEELHQMKPTAWLVNTSRGPLVDEDALISALTSRTIAGAALDVYGAEPLPPNHKLRSLDNVVATPHVGFVTKGTYEIFYGETVENLLAWMDGSPVRVMQ